MIPLTINYEFSFLPRGALCPGCVQESKNNASFRFFAVEKGRVAERVPGREKTGMTVVSVVCNERRWYIFVAPKAPLLPGEVPEEA